MSNVLKRLFLRYPVRDHERSPGDQVPMVLPSAPNHGGPGEIPTLRPRPVQAANDSRPVEQAHGSKSLEPAGDPKPFKPPNDEETVETQIAALLSAWDRTSLRARREFLTRIDQRIMTAHRIRSAPNSGSEATAG
jgi:hypothetical protein